MKRNRIVQVIPLCVAVFFFCGCKKKEDIARSVVKGTVTFDGTPVETGIITFVPVQGETAGAPVQLAIKNGAFSSVGDAQDDRGVVTGVNEVRILAVKKTGKQIKNVMGEMEEEEIQYIPEKYNEKSELTQEVKPGSNEFQFELLP